VHAVMSWIDQCSAGNLDDLLAFVAVGQERSFTKAAAKLGVSQSALSHTIRQLESRLGVRLLSRTTRSVSPTEAGERLLHNVAPRLEEIDAEIAAVTELREKPAGTIRITGTEYAADAIILFAAREAGSGPSLQVPQRSIIPAIGA
jgi:DNA-binding transcriptional LysR family regulator